MYAHLEKITLMGCEFGQWLEWNESQSLDWHLLDWENHQGIQKIISDLNKSQKHEKALHQSDFDWRGFEWIDFNDADRSIISFIRRAKDPSDFLAVVLNFTPAVYEQYHVVYKAGEHEVIMNSDSEFYGSNVGEMSKHASWGDWQNQTVNLTSTILPSWSNSKTKEK